MGQPGDARAAGGGKELEEEPDDQEDGGRDIHGRDQDEEEDQGAHARRGKKRQVGAHHPGDRPAGADDRE